MGRSPHAIEAVVSKQANPISEGPQHCRAIRMIAEHLPACIDRPKDLEARVQMQMASSMAGWAFSVAGVGLVHGMSHAVGARCGVPHGTGNGILLPHDMRSTASAAGPKLALVARAHGHAERAHDERLALSAADAVAALLVRIEHPTPPCPKWGEASADLDECAALALTDGATMTNPRGHVVGRGDRRGIAPGAVDRGSRQRVLLEERPDRLRRVEGR